VTTTTPSPSAEVLHRYLEGSEKFSLANRAEWRRLTEVLSDHDREYLTEVYERRMRAAGKHAIIAAEAGYACIMSDSIAILEHDAGSFREDQLRDIVDELLGLDYDDGTTPEEAERIGGIGGILHSVDRYRSEAIEDYGYEANRLFEAYVLGPDLGDADMLKRIEDDALMSEVDARIAEIEARQFDR
jgi:hypothetical protein